MSLQVHAFEADNGWRNLEYVLVCPTTGDALVIDPWNADTLADVAAERGWAVKQILNTHHHFDHVKGNSQLVQRTGATVLCHAGATDNVPGASVGLGADDTVKVGQAAELRVLDTPGHTMAHVCLVGEADTPFLVAGDTLFDAGAGNCKNGGHPVQLFETFRDQLWTLPDELRLYPGHVYLQNNLGFTLDREPSNPHVAAYQGEGLRWLTIGEQRRVNTFFRLEEVEVVEGLRAAFPGRDLSSLQERFVALRELRNGW